MNLYVLSYRFTDDHSRWTKRDVASYSTPTHLAIIQELQVLLKEHTASNPKSLGIYVQERKLTYALHNKVYTHQSREYRQCSPEQLLRFR